MDKRQVNMVAVVAIVLVVIALGMLLTFAEHTRPLQVFRAETERLAKGEIGHLQPSKFGGAFRKIASDLSDGIDHAVSKGGGTTRAADLGQVLGDLPAEPKMSAFSFPGPEDAPGSAPSSSRGLPEPPPSGPSSARRPPPSPPPAPPSVQRISGPGNAVPDSSGPPTEPTEEWMQVFEDFVALKQQCGEKTDGFTFEKFQGTLRKNRDAIMARHGVKRVKFSVYAKDGKAALKASPVKD